MTIASGPNGKCLIQQYVASPHLNFSTKFGYVAQNKKWAKSSQEWL